MEANGTWFEEWLDSLTDADIAEMAAKAGAEKDYERGIIYGV